MRNSYVYLLMPEAIQSIHVLIFKGDSKYDREPDRVRQQMNVFCL